MIYQYKECMDIGFVSMASSSKGKGAVKTVEWWKHLRWRKRDQNKRVREDGKKQVKDVEG